MNFNFFIPAIKNGGGEKVTLQIMSELGKSYPKDSIRLISSVDNHHRNSIRVDVKIDFSRKLVTALSIIKFVFSKRCTKNDVNISVLTGMNILLGSINFILRSKLILYEHSDLSKIYNFKNEATWKFQVRKILYNFAILNSKCLIFVSDIAQTNSLKYLWSINHKKVRIVYNPVADISDRVSLVTNNTRNTILIVARHSPEKRIIEGLQYLSEQRFDGRVVIVTDNDDGLKEVKSPTFELNVYSDLCDVELINLSRTVLFNFSLAESFSLIIAEWLKLGGRVASTQNSEINKIWSGYYNFYEFCEYKPHGSISGFFDFKDDAREKYTGRAIANTIYDLENIMRMEGFIK